MHASEPITDHRKSYVSLVLTLDPEDPVMSPHEQSAACQARIQLMDAQIMQIRHLNRLSTTLSDPRNHYPDSEEAFSVSP